MENTKKCKKCGRELPLSEFYKHKRTADGHLSTCKECHNQYTKKWRVDNLTYYKEYYSENVEHLKQYSKQYMKQHYVEHIEAVKQYMKKYNNTKRGRAVYLASSYKKADKKADRENNIDAKWIQENIFPSKCIYCGETNWRELGCDRIDNSIGHLVDNVVCCCGKCNIERGTKPFKEFLTLKQQKKFD